MRRSFIAVLTYLSLLASIGSFMISALPLLDCTTCPVREAAEQKPGDLSVTQTEPARRQYVQLSREWLITVCIWVIVGGMTGITIIRLLRKER